jgi:hypothetical protein
VNLVNLGKLGFDPKRAGKKESKEENYPVAVARF